VPRLVATSGALQAMVNWSQADLDQPVEPERDAHGEIAPQGFERFDLAPYKIALGEQAVGLRGGWNEMFAGGGADYTALYLFAIIDGRLEQVLAVPMSSSVLTAGDWHEDGNRDHTSTEGENVLIVSPHLTQKHFDLILKSRTSPWQRVFRWSEAVDAYQAVGG